MSSCIPPMKQPFLLCCNVPSTFHTHFAALLFHVARMNGGCVQRRQQRQRSSPARDYIIRRQSVCRWCRCACMRIRIDVVSQHQSLLNVNVNTSNMIVEPYAYSVCTFSRISPTIAVHAAKNMPYAKAYEYLHHARVIQCNIYTHVARS